MADPHAQIIAAYSGNAERLAQKYTTYDRSAMFPRLDMALGSQTKHILDIGAGNGVDAYRFAQEGRQVTAVEPSELRLIGQAKNNHPNITWVNDRLPDLLSISGTFDLVMLNRVFMHVHPDDQLRAFRRVMDFVAPNGVVYMITRHGPSMDNRTMFPVDLEALRQFVDQSSDFVWHNSRADYPDYDGRPEVTWSVVIITRR